MSNNIFVNNDVPECIYNSDECKCNHFNKEEHHHKKYTRRGNVVNMPHTDKPIPGPFVPDYTTESVHHIDNSPNIVPNTYLAPGHHHRHHHHDRNIHPMECHCDDKCGGYVTKHELNHILAHIAKADIFRDISIDGTTVAVGGIKKGTKFDKITFSELIEKMLYPETVAEDDVYACKSPDGKRTILNSVVKYPIGDLKEGDSLEGMTVSQILEAMLCGKNKWGTYLWKSNIVPLNTGTTTIDCELDIPELVEDFDFNHKYEMLVICKSSDIGNESVYKYNEIIARLFDKHQKTNVSIDGVPSDIKWSYNPESKKITLHTDEELAEAIAITIVRR